MIKPQKLNKVILDSLAFNGWKVYEGSNPLYVGAWVRGDVAMTIFSGRTIKTMYHVALFTPTSSNNRFVQQTVLLDIIEGKAEQGE